MSINVSVGINYLQPSSSKPNTVRKFMGKFGETSEHPPKGVTCFKRKKRKKKKKNKKRRRKKKKNVVKERLPPNITLRNSVTTHINQLRDEEVEFKKQYSLIGTDDRRLDKGKSQWSD